MHKWLVASALIPLACLSGCSPEPSGNAQGETTSATAAPPSATGAKRDGWLSGAPDDAERTRRLERYLRGFDVTMWEVGERYERVEQAVRDGNYELADYHWEKIRTSIEAGLMKRPKRQPNAEALFLGEPWQGLDVALKGKDPARIQQALGGAKAACMACHAAEKVAFVNDQPLFRQTAAANK